MDRTIIKSNLLLLVAAFFWGTTFVAQRIGMDALGPLAFTGIRFSLGTLVLVPFLIRQRQRRRNLTRRWSLAGICLAGLVLCMGINLQQFGLVYHCSTAGCCRWESGSPCRWSPSAAVPLLMWL